MPRTGAARPEALSGEIGLCGPDLVRLDRTSLKHQAYLSGRVPRVQRPEHGLHLANVAWTHLGSGFTLLFELAMLAYVKQMPIAPLATMAREHLTAPRWKTP